MFTYQDSQEIPMPAKDLKVHQSCRVGNDKYVRITATCHDMYGAERVLLLDDKGYFSYIGLYATVIAGPMVKTISLGE